MPRATAACNDDFGGGLGFCDDIENLTAVKLYFEISPMEKLSINAAVIWARWTEPVGFNYRLRPPGQLLLGMATYTPWYDSTTDLGWEIDLGLNYEIMEGLTYTLAAGVLFTGDSFDYWEPGGNARELGPDLDRQQQPDL